ncbi:hypothetical protein Sa4125_22810 [Aureimonas sp. SA4125]|uniref:eCIS core domain-containing protein n=1 Tax=Aureimonas sp. SA4125 TaxID=2826993 RepID=UPI001CC4D223|nr:DUF4157 domain-containing protein [Aureimonas sp. SA4125]BDA84739.1 hypothetical protein Sa4125_22810 [Aureimonas sp. SA4125]
MSAARLALVPSPAVPPKTTVTPATLAVQRKCATCEHEDRLQRRPRAGQAGGPLARLGERLEGAVQPKLRINAPGDRYEQEADRLADLAFAGPPQFALPRFDAIGLTAPASSLGMGVTPLQRHVDPAAERTIVQRDAEDVVPDVADRDDEGMMQMRRSVAAPAMEHAADASPTFEREVETARANGDRLPPALRSDLESRLGVDLSRVRIHTDQRAARLAASVDALAFTVGSHVWFGAGRFDPASDTGRRLLAHELVHTLQQEPAQIRPAQVPAAPLAQRPAGNGLDGGPAETAVAAAEPGLVQRADTFVPEGLPSGEDIHQSVLGRIASDGKNGNLFTEVRIPGASKSAVGADRTGRADLYMVESGEKTTIAVNMDAGEPVAFASHKDLRRGGAAFSHATLGAPKGAKKGGSDCGVDANNKSKKVCRLDMVPKDIRFGDLKPPAPVEILLGKGQISNYRKGVANTASALNTFITQNPTLADPEKTALGQPIQWTPDTGTIDEKAITIPPSVAFGTENKFPKVPLRLYRGLKRDDPISGLKGQIAVYKDKEAGIWAYEWIPTEIPVSVKAPTSSKSFKDAVERINELIGDLTAPPEKTGMGKFARRRRSPADGRIVAPQIRVQRKGTRSFDPVEWPKQYGDWKTSAKPLIETDAGAVPRVTSAIVEVKERSKLPLSLPQSFDKTAKDYRKLERWSTWGGVFGRLRRALGPLFVKFTRFYEKARDKFEELRRSKAESKPGSGIFGAILRGAFKIATNFVRVIIQRVAANMKTALTTAGKVLFDDFFQDTFVEKLIEAKTDLEAKVAEIEAEAQGAVDDKINAIIKPYEEKINFITTLAQELGDLNSLVSKVRWGARVIQCLTPPGVGCLKLILQEAAEKVLEMVAGTCWFQQNFIVPIFKKISFFTSLPRTLSDFLIGKIKEMLPFDAALKEKMFPKQDVSVALSNKDIDCESHPITKEQRELNLLFDAYGPQKVRDLIKLLEKGGVDEKRAISMAEIAKLRGLLEKMKKGELTQQQIKDALARHDPAKGFGNPAIDGVVTTLKGSGGAATGPATAGGGTSSGTAPAGGGTTGGGTPGTGGGGASQARRVAAKDAVPTFKGDGTSNCAQIDVDGGHVDDKNGQETKISLHGWANSTYVGEIYDVPATVASVTDRDDAAGKRRIIRYRLKQGAQFKHKVAGCKDFGYAAGTEAPQTFELAPAPAKAAAP